MRSDAIFIGVEIEDSAAGDAELAAKLEEVCPVDIFANEGGKVGIVEENLDGHMVSVSGQLDLNYVPFKDLINPGNMKTEVRFIKPGSDYHQLARFLETRTDKLADWAPGRRTEERS